MKCLAFRPWAGTERRRALIRRFGCDEGVVVVVVGVVTEEDGVAGLLVRNVEMGSIEVGRDGERGVTAEAVEDVVGDGPTFAGWVEGSRMEEVEEGVGWRNRRWKSVVSVIDRGGLKKAWRHG